MVEGVRHVEIDAEAHLDLVRRSASCKTPTVLVLDATGPIVRRARASRARLTLLRHSTRRCDPRLYDPASHIRGALDRRPPRSSA